MKNPCKQCCHAEHYPRGKTGKQHYYICTKNGCNKKEKYLDYLNSTHKYIKGEQIISIEELLNEEMAFIFDVPRHIEYIKHLQLALILQLINSGRIYKAIQKGEVISDGK